MKKLSLLEQLPVQLKQLYVYAILNEETQSFRAITSTIETTICLCDFKWRNSVF